jgi:hypothetical protein
MVPLTGDKQETRSFSAVLERDCVFRNLTVCHYVL